MEGRLITYCDGGLGNRLNGLIGGVFLARSLGLEPVVSWPINRWCAAAFGDLFEAPYDVCEDSMPDIGAGHPAHLLVAHQQMTFPMPVSIHPADFLRARTYVDAVRKALDAATGVIYFNSLVPGCLPRGAVDAIARTLRVRAGYRARADEFLAGAGLLGRPYWGLHLRGTDAGFPPAYYDRWERICRLLPGPIVLCTDDRALEERFLRNPAIVRRPTVALPEKAAAAQGWNAEQLDEYGRAFSYNIVRGAEAVRESMIDFEILGRSRALPTSTSTFLENARRFGTGRSALGWLQDGPARLRHVWTVARNRSRKRPSAAG